MNIDGVVSLKTASSRVAVIVSSLDPGGAEHQAIKLVTKLTSHVDLIHLVVIKETQDRELSTDGIICHKLALSFARGDVRSYLVAAKKIRRHLVSFNIDTVLAFGASVTSLLVVSALGLEVKVFSCERTVPWKHRLDTINRLARWLTYRKIAGAICQTRAVAEWFEHHYCPPITYVIPNFPPQQTLPAKVQLLHKFNIICVARFRPEKGQQRLLQAFDLIHQNIPEYGLVFVGDGPEKSAMEEYSDSLSIREKILYIGDAQNVVDYYAAADIVVLPSYYEGYPNALCEAMQQGKPCIAFRDAISHTELIADGINGLLCDEAIGSLAEALLRLALDMSLQSRLGEAAARKMSALSVETICKKWLTVIALAGKGKLCAV
jgi:GalNAc-alpha-(1->4)-GalNAc-alpha-(1->3)-diNAcBac-PP-undecaprenol alpha-1,4-N-acetyl-D-galactosaminyltransferase